MSDMKKSRVLSAESRPRTRVFALGLMRLLPSLMPWMNHLVYLDYYSAMVDEKQGLRPDLTHDGVHPTSAGYAVMTPLAEKALGDALK
jgi:lysophospholipase L1-like esterase